MLISLVYMYTVRTSVTMQWPVTRTGNTVELPCFPESNILLNATRDCLPNGSWSEVNYSNCEQGDETYIKGGKICMIDLVLQLYLGLY